MDFKQIEKKWQKKWEESAIFTADDQAEKKYYVLEMFPYPSAAGLHMGHALNYTIGDIFARFKRMNGWSVLYPMGFDALGLPAENAAIKAGAHPKEFTLSAINNYIRQMKELGLSYDWKRTVSTCDPEYYKWNQFFFTKFLENGLVYKKKAPVNWCPKCNTVLANEQVHNGFCWRHDDTEVEIKHLEQWFIKTTKYAEELLEYTDKLDWPDRIKSMQKNWIGKSHGTEINFEIPINVTKAVIMHGKNTNSKEKWYPWLKEQLDSKGIPCFAPDLPNSQDPEINVWLTELEKTKPDENTVLIGHSRGGVSILRWLEQLPKGKKVKKVILVGANAGSSEKMNQSENNKGFYNNAGYDFKKIKSHCDDFVVIHSKDDKWVPFSDGEENAKGLEAKFKVYENKGHFVVKESPTIPEVLEEIYEVWPVFTTRPDTIYGVTFLVVSAQHTRLNELTTPQQKDAVAAFLKKLKSVSEKDQEDLEKEGVFTGSYAINPINNTKVPIYAGNFVVADYGTGMVMAVPAHDQRDFEFAKKYNIPIKQVIIPSFGEKKKNEEFRRTVSAVVQRKSDSKFLILRWEKQDWVCQPVGGIEEDEDLATAAQREVFEETGYKTKFVKKLGFKTDSHFYADHKKVFRHRRDQAVLLKLLDEEPKAVSEHEFKQHKAVWMTYKELLKEITHEYNKIGFTIFQKGERAYTDTGDLINSKEFNGLDNQDAKEKITSYLEKKGLGKRKILFKLRDWLVSRQRYWGTPIPIIYCDTCGIVPVPEKDLPVELPEDVQFGQGNPMKTSESFVNTTCPKCGRAAKRETDTMDTFFDSSWYFLRYTDNKNSLVPFDKQKAESWMPVNQYIGGAEHACMHLIYARFFTKALRDLGFIDIDEPFTKLFNQGMLHGPDGEKMSKSKGNVITPDSVSEKYGIDTARLFLVSVANPDKDIAWSEKGIMGSLKFINRLIKYVKTAKLGQTNKTVKSKLQRTIRDVSTDIKQFKYNFAVIKLRETFVAFEEEIAKEDLESFIKLFAPFCPHITEELWERMGNKELLSASTWPIYNESLIDEAAEAAQELAMSVRADIIKVLELAKLKQAKKITIIISDPWKYELFSQLKKLIETTRNPKEIITSVMATNLKVYGKDITKIIPGVIKDTSKIPVKVLDQEKEMEAIVKVKGQLEKEFSTSIELVYAQNSNHVKARQASPNRPAIVVE